VSRFDFSRTTTSVKRNVSTFPDFAPPFSPQKKHNKIVFTLLLLLINLGEGHHQLMKRKRLFRFRLENLIKKTILFKTLFEEQ